jgi:hypothetical protein
MAILIRRLAVLSVFCAAALVRAEVFVYNQVAGVIEVLDQTDGTQLYQITPPSSFSNRVGLAHSGTSLFYGGFGTSNVIYELSLDDGAILNSFTPGGSLSSVEGLGYSTGTVEGPGLYVMDGVFDNVYLVDPSDGSLYSTFAPGNVFGALGADPDTGDFFVDTLNAATVLHLDSNGSLQGGLGTPSIAAGGLGVDGVTDSVFFGDLNTSTITEMSTAGSVLNSFSAPFETHALAVGVAGTPPVPEPGTMALLGIAATALAAARRRRRQQR